MISVFINYLYTLLNWFRFNSNTQRQLWNYIPPEQRNPDMIRELRLQRKINRFESKKQNINPQNNIYNIYNIYNIENTCYDLQTSKMNGEY
jgi:hypothetical protein